MKHLLFFLIFLSLGFQSNSEICGTYKPIFEKEYFIDSEKFALLKIELNSFKKTYKNEVTIIGRIEKSEETYPSKIYLIDSSFVKPKIITDKLNRKYIEKRIIEIEIDNSDTLYFRTTIENKLDVTVNRGKLIRIK
jgi:hypothetical protein